MDPELVHPDIKLEQDMKQGRRGKGLYDLDMGICRIAGSYFSGDGQFARESRSQ